MAAEEDTGFLSRWSRRKVAVRHGATPPEPVAEASRPDDLAAFDATVGATVAATVAATGEAAAAAVIEADLPATTTPAPTTPQVPEPPTEPLPTLADAAALTPASDFRRFVAPGVDPRVKNAALKTLFTDPHFNVMDGLDTYIDDYGKPDPLPDGMLRKMVQGQFLGLFSADQESVTRQSATSATPTSATPLAHDQPGHAPAQAPGSASPTPAPTDPSTPPDEDADLRLQPHDVAGREGPEPGAGQDARRQR